MSSRTVEGLINERGGGSGYRDIMRTTGELQGVFKDQDITSERRAYLNIICHKMARLIHGYGDDEDNILDIAGYSELERRQDPARKPSTNTESLIALYKHHFGEIVCPDCGKYTVGVKPESAMCSCVESKYGDKCLLHPSR